MSTGTSGAPRPLTVSVALCTHNGAAFVAEQVRSILAQTPPPLELVVGDDDSNDDTVAVIEQTHAAACAADPALATALRVSRRAPALGIARNFEATIASCTGDLIALSDQDDVWPAGRLAALAGPFASDNDLLLVHSDARLVDADGTPLGVTLLDALEATTEERSRLAAGDALPVLLRRSLVTGATTMIRARLLDLAGPVPAGWLHDEWLAVIAASVGRLRLLPAALLDYRQHGANQIGARRPSLGDRWRKLREPRVARAAWLAARASALADRTRALGVAREVQHEVDEKAAHEDARTRLPRFPLLRLPAVIAGTLTGRYHRYSRGLIDVLRDLVAPAGPPKGAPGAGRPYELQSGRR